jgi:hypothetical protein
MVSRVCSTHGKKSNSYESQKERDHWKDTDEWACNIGVELKR